ncbi:hypothetical protein, partial [Nitrospira sp. BLG_2]|uniref:hypothetical protein n=1 Tax=Nitrospira sp. BLG_2 TaxID=3397507 RepID=UPI003B9CEAD3
YVPCRELCRSGTRRPASKNRRFIKFQFHKQTLCFIFPEMGRALQPPHAQRDDIQHERDEPGEKDNPPADSCKGFTIVQREEPSQESLAAAQPSL